MMADYRALGRSSRATLRTTTLLFAALIPSSASTNAAATAEALLLLPSGGAVAFSRGASAFRIRFLPPGATDTPPFVTPLIAPDAADAPFQRTTDGIKAAIGRLALSSDGRLSLFNVADTMLVRTQPLHLSAGPSITFESSKPQRLYGRGGGPTDGAILSTPLGSSVTPGVENLEVLTPHYWSSLGLQRPWRGEQHAPSRQDARRRYECDAAHPQCERGRPACHLELAERRQRQQRGVWIGTQTSSHLPALSNAERVEPRSRHVRILFSHRLTPRAASLGLWLHVLPMGLDEQDLH